MLHTVSFEEVLANGSNRLFLSENLSPAVDSFCLIVSNDIIPEFGYLTRNEFADLMRKYSKNSEAIQFLSDMLEE